MLTALLRTDAQEFLIGGRRPNRCGVPRIPSVPLIQAGGEDDLGPLQQTHVFGVFGPS